MAALVVCSAALGGAWLPSSGAYYLDTGVSDANTVDAGTLDVKLNETGSTNGHGSTTDESDADVVVDTWEDTNHDTLGTHNVTNTIRIGNPGSTADVAEVNVSVEYVESDGTGGTVGNADNTSKTIAIKAFSYGGRDLTANLTDLNGDGELDLYDLTLPGNEDELTGLSGVPVGGSADLTVALSGTGDLIGGVDSGDGVDLTVWINASGGFTDDDRSEDNTIRYG